MGRFIKKISIFLLFLCMAEIAAVCIGGELLPKQFTDTFMRYQKGGGGRVFERLQEVQNVRDVDILFLGTSHCYRGYDTRIFSEAGYSSFNLGSSIQTALQTELLLRRYLDSIRPKYVVFDVYPEIFGNTGEESATNLISNDRIDWLTAEMALKINSFKVYNTIIFGLYRRLTDADSYEPPKREDECYVPGGFLESKRTECHSKKKICPKKYEFLDNQVEAFDNILSMFEERHIPYILVQAPITKKLYRSKANNDEADAFIARKGKYYNFNRILEMDDRYDFLDDDHLSQKGVVKFNAKLLELMRRDGFLKNTR